MRHVDEALLFTCAGERLVGVLSKPDAPGDTGVVVIVGGPQYRVGSHRQFVTLARALAEQGIATLRFDYRGMGDSAGATVSFERVGEDIRAAIDALFSRCPCVTNVVLWGLCDGASAGLLYLHGGSDARVRGLCLLNPWVRNDTSLARAHVKHYYGRRLLQREFWFKLLRGRVDAAGSVRELLNKIRLSVARDAPTLQHLPFQARMANALREHRGQVLLILSGKDYTAKEFLEHIAADSAWTGLIDAANVRRHDVPDADHTFSTAKFRVDVERATLRWIVETVAQA